MDELETTLDADAADLMWEEGDPEGPLNLTLPVGDDSAVSRSTRSRQPELIQGIP